MLLMAVARSSSDGVAIRYVLPVSWMTLCVQIISVNKLHEKSILRVTQHRALRIWHRGVYSNWPTRSSSKSGWGVWCLQLHCSDKLQLSSIGVGNSSMWSFRLQKLVTCRSPQWKTIYDGLWQPTMSSYFFIFLFKFKSDHEGHIPERPRDAS